MKKLILGFILGGIVFSGIVCAATYLATDISYVKKDGTQINVNEALDSLYDKQSELDRYKIKRTSMPAATSIDVKEYSDNWAELTVENFALDADGYGSANIDRAMVYGGWASASAKAVIDYDNLTGILTISVTSTPGTYPAGGSGNPGTLTAGAGLTINAVYLYEVDKG